LIVTAVYTSFFSTAWTLVPSVRLARTPPEAEERLIYTNPNPEGGQAAAAAAAAAAPASPNGAVILATAPEGSAVLEGIADLVQRSLQRVNAGLGHEQAEADAQRQQAWIDKQKAQQAAAAAAAKPPPPALTTRLPPSSQPSPFEMQKAAHEQQQRQQMVEQELQRQQQQAALKAFQQQQELARQQEAYQSQLRYQQQQQQQAQQQQPAYGTQEIRAGLSAAIAVSHTWPAGAQPSAATAAAAAPPGFEYEE
jgi:flagellar biosynthesis GTPase FlhF